MMVYLEDRRLSYIDRMNNLFTDWRKKSEVDVKGDHLYRNRFLEDGIVDYEKWSTLYEGKRILFVLKEVNDKKQEHDWTIQKLLNDDAKYRMWRRVSEWTKGIIETSKDGPVVKYAEISEGAKSMEWLNYIAVINLKKAPGFGTADMKTIKRYAIVDADEIRREIEIIDPDLIILGGTKDAFGMVFDINQLSDSNKYLYSYICGRKRQIISFYHPANRKPKDQNYYEIMDIYIELQKHIRGN